MKNEIWKPIGGYEGLYEVSNLGRIKRVHSVIKRKYRNTYRMKTIKEKILKLAPSHNGYLSVCLCKKGVKKKFRVHRLVAMAFIPNPENKKFVNHKDFIKTNNCVDNIEWCTNAENEKHALENGRKPRGESCGKSLLSRKDVLSIRRLYKNTETSYSKLSDEFSTSIQNISRIINRKTWKHI